MGRLRAALFHASADGGRGGDKDDVASLALRVRKSSANLAGPSKARGRCTGCVGGWDRLYANSRKVEYLC
jgi:hypothetical protein